MHTVNIGNYKEEFVLHFGCEFRRINAYTFASTLVSIADSIKDANNVINPGYEVEIVVEAVGQGSFRARIKTVYHKLNNIFSAKDLKMIVIGVITTYISQKLLPSEAKIEVATNEVLVETGDRTIVVPREVYECLGVVQKSESFKNGISRAFRAVENDGTIMSFGITDDMEDERVDIEIKRDQFAIISSPPAIELNERVVTEVVDLYILRAILERSKRKWEFVWRGMKISAPILDQKFYDEFFAHQVTIAPGDYLKVRMNISQKREINTGIFTNEKYEIIEVLRHISRVKQLKADLDPGEY